MKFIKIISIISHCIFLFSCIQEGKKSTASFPAYKLIQDFSKTIKQQTGLTLRAYGVNHHLPKDYPYQNTVANFSITYTLQKTQNDTISLEYARELLIALTETLLQEINLNQHVRADLEIYPFTRDRINITIRFEDENQIDLGTGVSGIYYWKGKIEYERYEIHEYTGRYPATGEHFIIHKEPYEEALEIVKNNGTLVYFQ